MPGQVVNSQVKTHFNLKLRYQKLVAHFPRKIEIGFEIILAINVKDNINQCIVLLVKPNYQMN